MTSFNLKLLINEIVLTSYELLFPPYGAFLVFGTEFAISKDTYPSCILGDDLLEYIESLLKSKFMSISNVFLLLLFI